MTLRNKVLEEKINEMNKEKEEILQLKSQKRGKSTQVKENSDGKEANTMTPLQKEIDDLEKEYKTLQIKNQKLNNKITLVKMSMNMDSLTRFSAYFFYLLNALIIMIYEDVAI